MKIGKNLLAVMIAGAISAGFTSAYGGTSVTRNGVTWAGTYEGTTFPQSETPAWAGFGGGGSASGSSDGNIWSQTTVLISYLYYEQTDPTWTSATTQKSIEFRAQVVAQTAPDRAFDVIGTDATGYWDVQLSSNGVVLVGSVSIGALVPVDNSTFHTYRLTIDDSLSVDQAKLYLDNNATPVVTSGANAPASSFGNLLTFGDRATAGVGGTTALDFISWTSGIFPPGTSTTTNGVPSTIGKAVGVSWFGSNSVTYQVQSTTNLTTNTVWSNFGSPVSGAGSTNTAFDFMGNTPSKFYRVISLQ
jgi:hypothetical protein